MSLKKELELKSESDFWAELKVSHNIILDVYREFILISFNEIKNQLMEKIYHDFKK